MICIFHGATEDKPTAQRPQTERHEQARNFYLLQQSLQSRRITFILPRCGFIHLPKVIQKTTPSGNNGICIQYKFAKHIKISFYNLFFCSNQFSLLVCHSANCVVGKTEPKHDLNTMRFLRLNIPTFVHCIRCAFSSSPSVQSHESAVWRRSGVSGR